MYQLIYALCTVLSQFRKTVPHKPGHNAALSIDKPGMKHALVYGNTTKGATKMKSKAARLITTMNEHGIKLVKKAHKNIGGVHHIAVEMTDGQSTVTAGFRSTDALIARNRSIEIAINLLIISQVPTTWL